jgi:4-hydroxy-tetrahydrodipicolinate synthase
MTSRYKYPLGEGVYTALATPFRNGAVDEESVRKLVRQQLDGRIHGLVVCGTTGESPTLSDDERDRLFKLIQSEVGGQVPLVMGTGTNGTAETIRLTRRAKELGADAALVVVPYYNKPSQAGLIQHYRAAAQVGLPVLLYNVPSRTVAKLEPASTVELSKIDGIIGIKEATGDMALGRGLIAQTKKDFVVTSGDDGTWLDLVGLGGRGVISVISNLIPRKMSDWYVSAKSGADGLSRAQGVFRDWLPLNSALYLEANPIPVKSAMKLVGLFASAEMLLPLTEMDSALRERMANEMRKVGLL